MGVALQDGTVHECTGVAFICIADQVFLISFCSLEEGPLLACEEAGTAAPLEARFLKQVYYIIAAHGQGFLYSLVTAGGNVFIYVLRVNLSAVLKGYLDLRAYEALGSLIIINAVSLRQLAGFNSIKKLFCKSNINLAESSLNAICDNFYNRFLKADSYT